MSGDRLKLAREKLSANNYTEGLPGREEHFTKIYNFIYERLKIRPLAPDKRARLESDLVANIPDRHFNKTIFICGVPGTGKTVTVQCVIDRLLKESMKRGSPINKFQYIYINGQHLTKPKYIYTEILRKLTGENHAPDQAEEILGSLLTPGNEEYSIATKLRKRKKTKKRASLDGLVVAVVDELDLLYTDKRQRIFYNLFDWPTSVNSKLILITIANAMDLPERCMRGKISSRIGWEKLVFESYTSDCLKKILESRLGANLMKTTFDEVAIIVATKRIGRTTGDARRVLNTCQLALDQAIRQKINKVTPAIMDSVGFQNLDSGRIEYVSTCSPLELCTLKSILRHSAHDGEENVDTAGVFKHLMGFIETINYFEGITVDYAVYSEILNSLSGSGFIYLETDKPLMQKKMCLMDSSDAFQDLISNQQPRLERRKVRSLT